MSNKLSLELFSKVHDGIIITDPQLKIIRINPAMEEICGFSNADLQGKTPAALQSGYHKKDFYQDMWQDIKKKGFWTGEIWDRKKDGELYFANLSISALKNDAGEIINYVGITVNKTFEKKYQSDINQITLYDSLTKLPNKTFLYQQFEKTLSSLKKDEKLAVLFIAIDNFKKLNDAMGYTVGDLLLQMVSVRLSSFMGPHSFLARFSGCEFILLHQFFNKDLLAKQIATLQTELSKPFDLESESVRTSVSIGVSLYPDNASDLNDLIKKSSISLSQVKKKGKNSFHYFSKELEEEAIEWIKIKHDLEKAILRNELKLVFQPKVDIASKAIKGMEALLRWNHSEYGPISPAKFIPIAEETGLIVSIGAWVMEQACKLTKKIHDMGLEDLKVSINVSGIQLHHDNFLDLVDVVMDITDIEPKMVELELTESSLMVDIDNILLKLKSMKGKGISLSIDDFGTGYSSMNYLQKLPIDTLKIDRSFIVNMKEKSGRAIVSGIISFASNLNLSTVAEGVDSEKQLETLEFMLCDEIQGFLFSPPLEFDDFIDFVKNFSNNTVFSNLS